MGTAWRRGTIVLAAGAAAVLIAAGASAVLAEADDTGDSRKLEALTARVERIERELGIVRGEARTASIESRLRTLEQGLRDLNRAAGGERTISVSGSVDELRRTIDASRNRQEELARKVERLERQASARGGADRDARDVQRSLTELRRKVDDALSRVRRLESRS